jgi:hypothetical protein
MSHPENPEHGHEPAASQEAAPSAFTEEEWKEIRAQDLAAARRVVGLMMGIFVIGLLLYTGVALWVEARGV